MRACVAQRTRSPHRGPARLTERLLERPGRGQRLECVDRGAGAPHEIFHIAKRRPYPLVVDVVAERVVQAPHRSQPEPHRVMRRLGEEAGLRPSDRADASRTGLERGVTTRPVDVGAEHLDTVTARVADDRVR